MKPHFNFQDAEGNLSTAFSNYNEKKYLVPEVDILEDDTRIYYVYELPGIEAEELNVELSPENIFIAAESKVKDGEFIHQERQKGSFFRKLPIPANVDVDSAQADFKNGLLEISFEKLNNF